MSDTAKDVVGCGCGCLWLLVWLAFWGGITVVLVHFVLKFW